VFDEVLAVTAVDPDLADRVAGGGDLVERNPSSWRGYTVRIVDDTGEELGTYDLGDPGLHDLSKGGGGGGGGGSGRSDVWGTVRCPVPVLRQPRAST
jgi:hypothetical protein